MYPTKSCLALSPLVWGGHRHHRNERFWVADSIEHRGTLISVSWVIHENDSCVVVRRVRNPLLDPVNEASECGLGSRAGRWSSRVGVGVSHDAVKPSRPLALGHVAPLWRE